MRATVQAVRRDQVRQLTAALQHATLGALQAVRQAHRARRMLSRRLRSRVQLGSAPVTHRAALLRRLQLTRYRLTHPPTATPSRGKPPPRSRARWRGRWRGR